MCGSQDGIDRRTALVGAGYPDSIDVELVNTGSPDEFATVRADVPPGAAGIALGGTNFDLMQFHWHTPSEHRVEGRPRALEMHLVHSPDGAFWCSGCLSSGAAPTVRWRPCSGTCRRGRARRSRCPTRGCRGCSQTGGGRSATPGR
jgi:hypothetical protein